MGQVIGRINGSVLVESVVVEVDGDPQHRYRLRGGPEDGREFATLAAVGDYAIAATEKRPA